MNRFWLLGILILLLSSCSSPYSLADAEHNGDIIVGHSEPPNYAKLDSFIADIKTGTSSKLRITNFTVEGDLILNDLEYDGDTIHYVFDNSRDKHGGPHKGKDTTQCKAIEAKKSTRIEPDSGHDYVLTGCDEIIGSHDGDKPEIYLLFKKD